MKSNSKPLWIVLIAALLAAIVCVAIVFFVRNGIGREDPQSTTVVTSSTANENQKIREAIAEDFIDSIHDNQPEGEADYEPLTLPPEGETFSFAFSN